jgi:hypothetical protein
LLLINCYFIDIPAWLRSLRLHKYNSIFSDTNWQTIVKMNDADLLAKGVAALGARRKMLKVFENIRAHCDANVSLIFTRFDEPDLTSFFFFF